MTVLRYVPGTRHSYVSRTGESVWSPDVDIIEYKDTFTIDLDIPGFKKDDVTINVKDGILTVTGERKAAAVEDDKYYRYLERPTGGFERSFRLHEHVDGEKITASYDDGVLRLVLPKKEDAKSRCVEIA